MRLHRLEAPDRPAELDATGRVLDRDRARPLERARHQRDAGQRSAQQQPVRVDVVSDLGLGPVHHHGVPFLAGEVDAGVDLDVVARDDAHPPVEHHRDPLGPPGPGHPPDRARHRESVKRHEVA